MEKNVTKTKAWKKLALHYRFFKNVEMKTCLRLMPNADPNMPLSLDRFIWTIPKTVLTKRPYSICWNWRMK